MPRDSGGIARSICLAYWCPPHTA